MSSSTPREHTTSRSSDRRRTPRNQESCSRPSRSRLRRRTSPRYRCTSRCPSSDSTRCQSRSTARTSSSAVCRGSSSRRRAMVPQSVRSRCLRCSARSRSRHSVVVVGLHAPPPPAAVHTPADAALSESRAVDRQLDAFARHAARRDRSVAGRRCRRARGCAAQRARRRCHARRSDADPPREIDAIGHDTVERTPSAHDTRFVPSHVVDLVVHDGSATAAHAEARAHCGAIAAGGKHATCFGRRPVRHRVRVAVIDPVSHAAAEEHAGACCLVGGERGEDCLRRRSRRRPSTKIHTP